METEQYLLYGIIIFVISACTTLVPEKRIRILACFISLLGSLSFFFLGFYLIAATRVTFDAPSVTSIFKFALRGNALSGFFLVFIFLITLATSLYSIGFTSDLAHSNLVGFFLQHPDPESVFLCAVGKYFYILGVMGDHGGGILFARYDGTDG